LAVFSSPKSILIDDDHDITLINNTGGTIDLNSITFSSVDGNTQSNFNANRWRSTLEAGNCTQLWSVGRTNAKDVEGCDSIYWLTTNNPAEHFWTGANGATTFRVTFQGVEQAICTVSTAGVCEFFLPSSVSSPVTDHIFFIYNPNEFIIYNNVPDSWMSLIGTYIRLPDTDITNPIVNPDAFGVPEIGTLDRLAPHQCLLITNNVPEDFVLSQDCYVVASVHFEQDLAWWANGFSFLNDINGLERTCPPVDEQRLTYCILPR